MGSFKPTRERKHKRVAKVQKQNPLGFTPSGTWSSDEDIGSNTAQLIPASTAEKDARRKQLQEELKAQQPIAVTGQKRKRLDKYIDTKLRREENAELIKRLSKQRVDTSLLRSSKKLGRVSESRRERLSRALAERKAGIGGDGDHDQVLFEPRNEIEEDKDSDEDYHEEAGVMVEVPLQRNGRESAPPSSAISGFGAGLKRPLDVGGDGKPVITKRKRRKVIKGKSAHLQFGVEARSDDEAHCKEPEEWFGFSDDGKSDSDSSSHGSENLLSESESVLEHSFVDGASKMENESATDEEESSTDEAAPRISAFKAWANQQRNAALGFTPSALPSTTSSIAFKPRAPSPDPSLPQASTTEPSYRQSVSLTVIRSEAIQKARLELPVVQEEQKIMEAIHGNPISIICGATGSGKTTQVPQMLLENGYGSAIGESRPSKAAEEDPRTRGMIAVTQPRRVAAVSVAARVTEELGEAMKGKVAHQVRYDSTSVTKNTAIKFMTDGILLREIQRDFILSKYSVVVIDEAHERSVNTDILIGMLSRIVELRKQLSEEEPGKFGHYPLKLVIMSATLRINDFTANARLFRNGPPPIVQAEGRQYPVTVHFAQRTVRDYVAETVIKVVRGHKKLPAGGMLVFLTGQDEIVRCMKELKRSLGGSDGGYTGDSYERVASRDASWEAEDFADSSGRRRDLHDNGEEQEEDDPEIRGLDNDDADAVHLEDEFDVRAAENSTHFIQPSGAPMKPYILPLYASLPTREQMKPFQPAPLDTRMIVLATNVAETSLTIPGIRYVFDCGRSKEKKYDTSTGVQTFEVGWISKASALQREGRAGRTGPGHCWKLYSSAVYERDFAEHIVPEILRTPLEGVVLSLKEMHVENVVNFPFPTPPDRQQLSHAERLLKYLGAIDTKGRVTEVGREISRHPLNPRYGKILHLARLNGVLGWAVAAVAALASGEVFLAANIGVSAAKEHDGGTEGDESSDDEDARGRRIRTQEDNAAATVAEQRRKAYGSAHASLSKWDDHSDAIKLLTLVAAAVDIATTPTALREFCDKFFVREKALQEVLQLRQQLSAIVRNQTTHNTASRATPADTEAPGTNSKLKPPSDKQRALLKQVIAAGFVDQVAIRADLLPAAASASTTAATKSGNSRKARRAVDVAYRTLLPSLDAELLRALGSQDERERAKHVYVHPSSVLAHLSVAEMPSYIVYSHLSCAAPSSIGDPALPAKTRMHPLTTVSARQLAALAEGSPMLVLGKPVGRIEQLLRDGAGREGRSCWVGLAFSAPVGEEGGGAAAEGWHLGAWKVEQRRLAGGGWEVERVVAR